MLAEPVLDAIAFHGTENSAACFRAVPDNLPFPPPVVTHQAMIESGASAASLRGGHNSGRLDHSSQIVKISDSVESPGTSWG